MKRPIDLYLAEPPSFTPSETPIEIVPSQIYFVGGSAVDDGVGLMHVDLPLRFGFFTIQFVGEKL